MKNYLSLLAALALLFSCTPEKTPGGDNNNNGGNSQPTVVELTGIALTEHEITLEKGGNKVLEVKFTPSNASNKSVTWVSSNTSIATVTDGVVVGVAPGSTEIIAKSGNFTDKCQVTVVVSATSVSLDLTELTLSPGETATLKATVLPEDSTDEVEWSSSDEMIATVQDGVVTAVGAGEATITAKAGTQKAECKVTVLAIPDGAANLGIVMTRSDGTTYKLYWAKSNLSTSGLCANPEDYGDYYAWGETAAKDIYDWSTYKWANGNGLTKYNTGGHSGTVDNKTLLDSEDDVAHVSLGGNWRMPTYVEWTALRDQCTWTWTTQNGINGILVTASNGNSIFLPAAGYRNDPDGIHLEEAGFSGNYWSSSLNTYDLEDAYFIYFDSNGIGMYTSNPRYLGFSVRAVSE